MENKDVRPEEGDPERIEHDVSRLEKEVDELEALELDDPEPAREESITARTSQDFRRRAAARGRERDFLALQGVISTVMAELDLGLLVRAILEQTVRLLGADRGILFLGRQRASSLVPVCAMNLKGEELGAVDRVSRTILERTEAGVLTITNDAISDSFLREIRSIRANRIHSVLCAPLIAPSGPIGAIYLDAASPHVFSEASVPLAKAVAQVAAVALENAQIHSEMIRGTVDRGDRSTFDGIGSRLVGSSKQMETLRRQASLAALLDMPIHISGEVGTGRRLLARIIHETSRRASERFVTVECTAAPTDRLRDMLIGRVGAAARNPPGAVPGVFRLAAHGTAYLASADGLDEDLGHEVLQILKRGSLRATGSRREERLCLRMVASTTPAISDGRRTSSFVEALSRGEAFMQLTVPALRDRAEDVPELVQHVLQATGRKAQVTPSALKVLLQHPWPGNIRELQQVVSRLTLLSGRPVIDVDDVKGALEMQPRDRHRFGPWSGDVRTLQDWEDEAIRQALAKAKGNKSRAATMLGIHRNTLALKLAGR